MGLVVLVCLFVNITPKSYGRIAIKFYGGVRAGKRIQITILTVQSDIWPLLNDLREDYEKNPQKSG